MPIIHRDILYRNDSTDSDTYAFEQCRLDLFLPEQSVGGFPLLVWFHGGGLTGGSRQGTDAVAARFAEQGVGVANASYRLGPMVRFPVYVEDAAAAVAWAVTEGVRLGADPGAIFVGGHSAGAYLAALLAMDRRFLRAANVAEERVAGYLPISGQLITHFHVRAERDIAPETMLVDEAAPLYFVRKDAPPMLLLAGDQDMPARREEAALFTVAMTEIAGNQTTSFMVVPDRDHGTVHEYLLLPGDVGGPAMISFINRYSR